MLVRLLVKNLFSFQELTEFNMLPGRATRLSHHLIKTNDIELLKLNAIYGANGAGKSNLLFVAGLLKSFVVYGKMPIEFITETFKFDQQSATKDIYIGIEFIKDDTPYYYGITINQGVIIEEELQFSGFGKKEDQLLFRRTDKIGQEDLEINFAKGFDDPEIVSFFHFLKDDMLERNQPVLHYMRSRRNEKFKPYKSAFDWFEINFKVILPHSKPFAIAYALEQNRSLHEFSLQIMQSFNTGITDIKIDTIKAEDYFGEDDKHKAELLTAELRANNQKFSAIKEPYQSAVFTLENSRPVIKRVVLYHKEDSRETKFELAEISDGTRRLLEYIPVLYSVIYHPDVFLIDEIERSIHPLLIKELIRKFSHDKETKGQLIFTTHESNLLDQEIFRTDEIWFVEKNKQEATELISLSEFKEHHTLDIRKGYLNGRYGAIPFLGNLKDLNWEAYAKAI